MSHQGMLCMKGADGRVQGLSATAAVVNALYVIAGCALFATGEAPVIVKGTDFLGDFVVAWAGWKFSGCLYMALVNAGVHLGAASAITMLPYIAFDVYAVRDPTHWTAVAYGFIVLEALTAVTALRGWYKVGGVINALYVLAGVALFAAGEAPVITPTTDFLGDSFAMAWAGWKFAGCLYYALINLGMHGGLALALAMVPYVGFDVLAMSDPLHWTRLAAGFLLFDGAMGLIGLSKYVVDCTAMSKASEKPASGRAPTAKEGMKANLLEATPR